MNARRSDEWGAQLEKYIERLPQYAERAQRQLRRHLDAQRASTPPSSEPDTTPDTGEPEHPQVSTEDLQRRARDAERARRKLQRRRAWSARALTLWIVIAVLSLILIAAGATGFAGVTAATALAGALVAVPATALAVRSGIKLRELNRRELPEVPALRELPPEESAAYEPMQRLLHAEASLSELLDQLHQQGSDSGVSDPAVQQAAATAQEAQQALRGLAARVLAIERAAAAAPSGDRAALDSAITTLRQQLDEGVESYGGLLAAAGHAVASSGGIGGAADAITDATDRLAGMAIALRELS